MLRLSMLVPLLGAAIFSTAAVAQEAAGATGAANAAAPGQMIIGSAPTRADSAVTPAVKISNADVAASSAAPATEATDPVPNPVADHHATNEFQAIINASTGRNLPLFGYNLFNRAPSTFAPVDRVPVTADYVIGPGDEIVIRAWGQIDMDYRATVDRNGDLHIPKVGNVNLTGLKYQELQGYLKTAIGRVFRNFELNVSLGQLRSIQVFVVGYANRPGSYTVSSLSTLVNTLFATGGPSARGSMRRIQLKRGDQIATEFDLYELLIKGDKSKDMRLLPGDVIYIPPVGSLVAVAGSVNTPAIFELKGGETIGEILRFAGGVTTTASIEKIALERIAERKSRIVEEFRFDDAGKARTVKDGDLLTVLSISPRFDNVVTLRGNVASPGRYAWRKGITVKDLVPEKEALITTDYWLRKNAASRTSIDSQGELMHDVKRSIAEINWDYAVIERLNKVDLTTQLIPFNLGKAISGTDPESNPELQPGDVITIFSKDDIRVPRVNRTRYVRIEGEVKQAGVYQVQPGETLRQLVARIGGFTPDAYPFGIEFTRESVRELQQQRMDEAIRLLEREIETVALNDTTKATSQDEALRTRQETDNRRALIAKLRQVRATGRIPLEIPADGGMKHLPDLALEDGDRMVVPSRPAVVSVVGSVYNPSAFLYRKEKSVSDYLEQAGGPTRNANTNDIYVFRADGTVISARQFGWVSGIGGQRLMPGDVIFVPEQLERISWLRGLKDWSQIFYQFGLGAAALKVLKD